MRTIELKTLFIITLLAVSFSCKDQANNKTETITEQVRTPSICLPSGPYDEPPAAVFAGIQKIDQITDESVRLNWKKIPEAKSYLVFQKSDQGQFKLVRTANYASKKIKIGGLADNTTYEFMVRYVDDRGLHDLNNVSLSATTLATPVYVNEKSLALNGVKSVNLAPSNVLTPNDTVTASVWFKTSRNNQSDVRIINFHKGSGASSSLYLAMNNRNLQFGYRNAADEFKKENISGNYADNSWHHAVVTYNGNIYVVYVDGVRQISVVDSFIGFGSHPAHLGSYTGTQKAFIGNVDEVSVWRSALSSNRIAEIYNRGTPNNLLKHSRRNTLMLWYRLGDDSRDSDSTVYDQAGNYNGTPNNIKMSDYKNDSP